MFLRPLQKYTRIVLFSGAGAFRNTQQLWQPRAFVEITLGRDLHVHN